MKYINKSFQPPKQKKNVLVVGFFFFYLLWFKRNKTLQNK